MCDLSIIIPVYNAEHHIRNTVKSLLTQKNVSYEIILVDDGSTDGSSTLCDELCNRSENVRCFHIKNGGPGKARNLGIKVACGKYIGFCDADDIPHDNMYGILFNTITSNSCDYCLCDIYTERDGRNFGFPWEGDQLFENHKVCDVLLASMLGNRSDDELEVPVWGSSVRALYKKELLMQHNVWFPENIRFAEDLVFNVRYLVHCSRSYVLNQVLYRYTFNKESLMNSYTQYYPNAFKEKLYLVQYLKEIVEPVDETGELIARLATSARCYFHECVGNAARAIPQKGVSFAISEIRTILNHPTVCNAFKNVDVRDKRKRLLYSLIHRKCAVFLTMYYGLRLRYQ